jgi:hypothetical protein
MFDRLRHGPRTVGVECEPYRFTASGARCGHRVQADLVQLDVAKPLRQGAFNCRCDQLGLRVAQQARVSGQLAWRAPQQRCDRQRRKLAGDVP